MMHAFNLVKNGSIKVPTKR